MYDVKTLGTDSIPRLIMRFSMPSMIAMTVSAIYNIIDRFFVSKYVIDSELALGGLTIVFPVMMIMFAFGNLFGTGGATLISIKFGEQNRKEPNRIFGNIITLVLVSSIVMVTFVAVFMRDLLLLIGATDDNLPFAMEFLSIILIGIIPQLFSFCLSSLARVEGHPHMAMISQIVSVVVNILMAWILMGKYGLGVSGSAWATVIGQSCGLIMLVFFFFIKKKSLLKLRLKNMLLNWSVVRNICSIGSASFVLNIGNFLSMSVVNIALRTYGDDPAITAAGAVSALYSVFLMPMLGLQQGVVPIIGYNHGMNNRERTWKIVWTAIGFGVCISVVVSALLHIFPLRFLSLFLHDGSSTIGIAVRALHLNFAMMPLVPVVILATAYFQATAKGGVALTLSLLRHVLVIPCVLVLPLILDLDGVWSSYPLTDFLCILAAIFLLIVTNRKSLMHAGGLIDTMRPMHNN